MSDFAGTVLSAETVRADDALLDGQLTAVPDSRQPVAGALAALRTAAQPAELGREAAARAGFRMFRPDGASDGAAPGTQLRSLDPRRPSARHPRGACWR